MVRLALIAAAGLTLAAAPAAAQTWGGTYDDGYRAARYGLLQRIRRAAVSAAMATVVRRRLRRPPFQRRAVEFRLAQPAGPAGRLSLRRVLGRQPRRLRRPLARPASPRQPAGAARLPSTGRLRRDGYGHGRYGYGNRRGYGSAYDYGHAQGSTDLSRRLWPARPWSIRADGRQAAIRRTDTAADTTAAIGSRSDWCRANYRSYDPRTGYYRAYSGRLIYCG